MNPQNQAKLRRSIATAGSAAGRLRFSTSGDPNIERAYRTHWLPPKPGTNSNRGG